MVRPARRSATRRRWRHGLRAVRPAGVPMRSSVSRRSSPPGSERDGVAAGPGGEMTAVAELVRPPGRGSGCRTPRPGSASLELIAVAAWRPRQLLYELLAWRGEGEDGTAFPIGLADPATLAGDDPDGSYDPQRSGQDTNRSGHPKIRSGAGQGPVRGRSGAGQGPVRGRSGAGLGTRNSAQAQVSGRIPGLRPMIAPESTAPAVNGTLGRSPRPVRAAWR